ncbi:unnamed protein product [Penicillium glandicola]
MISDRAPTIDAAQAASLPVFDATINQYTPGPWAARITALDYPCVRDGGYIKSSYLNFLMTLPPLREPVLRYGITWNASEFDHEIAKSARHVEAVYLFMVGHRVDQECVVCQREGGIFPYCVVIENEHGQYGCCNCHWDTIIEGCSLIENEVLPQHDATPTLASVPVPVPNETIVAAPPLDSAFYRLKPGGWKFSLVLMTANYYTRPTLS